MEQPNEVEVLKKALGIMSQRIATLTLDISLAHAQIEEMHAQRNPQRDEKEVTQFES